MSSWLAEASAERWWPRDVVRCPSGHPLRHVPMGRRELLRLRLGIESAGDARGNAVKEVPWLCYTCDGGGRGEYAGVRVRGKGRDPAFVSHARAVAPALFTIGRALCGRRHARAACTS